MVFLRGDGSPEHRQRTLDTGHARNCSNGLNWGQYPCFDQGASGNKLSLSGAGDLAAGKWHHVVFHLNLVCGNGAIVESNGFGQYTRLSPAEAYDLMGIRLPHGGRHGAGLVAARSAGMKQTVTFRHPAR